MTNAIIHNTQNFSTSSLCLGRRKTANQAIIFWSQPTKHSQGLADAPRHRPEGHIPHQNCSDQPASRSGTLVLFLPACFIRKLTVPWKDAVEEAFEQYANHAAEATERGRKVQICLAEVGCRGFVASSTARLLRDIGNRGQHQRKAIKDLASWTKQLLVLDQIEWSILGSQMTFRTIRILATWHIYASLISKWWAA